MREKIERAYRRQMQRQQRGGRQQQFPPSHLDSIDSPYTSTALSSALSSYFSSPSYSLLLSHVLSHLFIFHAPSPLHTLAALRDIRDLCREWREKNIFYHQQREKKKGEKIHQHNINKDERKTWAQKEREEEAKEKRKKKQQEKIKREEEMKRSGDVEMVTEQEEKEEEEEEEKGE